MDGQGRPTEPPAAGKPITTRRKNKHASRRGADSQGNPQKNKHAFVGGYISS